LGVRNHNGAGKTKAKGDYIKRTKEVTAEDRAE
jgi:hypothetical protein